MASSLISRLAGLAGLVTLFAGCCANNVCDCPNEAQADAIRIAFDSTFTAADLDTLTLVRTLHYSKNPLPTTLPRPEAVTVIRTAAHAFDPLIITNTTPFSQFGSARLDTFSYAVRYYPNAKPKVRPYKTVLVIDTVRLSGSLDGNGCCTCYTNTRKRVLFRTDSTAVQPRTYFDLRNQGDLLVK